MTQPVPQLPPGFTLDASPAVAVPLPTGNGAPALPPGFTADQPQTAPTQATAAPRSLTDEIKHQLGLMLRYGIEGPASIATIPGDAINGAINLGSGAINSVAGTHIPRLDYPSVRLDQSLTNAGLPEPQGTAEKVVGELSKGVASGAGITGAAKALEAAGVEGASALAGSAKLGSTGAGAAVPTNAALKATAQAAYKASDDAGAILAPQTMQKVASATSEDLTNLGYHPNLQPQIGTLLNELTRVSQTPITAKGVDTVRRMALAVAQGGNPSERMMAGKIIDHLDDMMENISPSDVVQGNATEAAAQLQTARAAWKTMRKSELIDSLVTKGEDQAMSTNSGGNVQNAIRQKLRGILDNPRTARLFNDEETAAIRQIVRGTATQNTLRTLGRFAPSSNGWLGVISTAAGGPLGAMIPIIGAAAKSGATALTNKAVDSLSTMVRSGGAMSAAVTPSATGPNATMARLLMQGMTVPNSPYIRGLIQELSGGGAGASNPNSQGPGQP